MEKVEVKPLDFIQSQDAWDKLSLSEKAEMMKVAVRNGIYNLHDIKEKYNEFAEGKNIYDGESESTQQIVTSGGAGYIPNNYGQGTVDGLRRRLYKNIEPFGYDAPIERLYNALVLNRDEHNEHFVNGDWEHAPAQYQTIDDIWGQYLQIPEKNRRYPNGKYHISKNENGTYSLPFESIEDIMYTVNSDNPILTGQRGKALNSVLGEYDVYRGFDEKGDFLKYIDIWDVNPWARTTDDKEYGVNKDNTILRWLFKDKDDVSFGLGVPVEIQGKYYLDDVYGVPRTHGHYLPEVVVTGSKHSMGGPLVKAANEYKHGGGIHIKKENRGKFTRLKERTRHSASWFKEHGTPAQKKMAVFELNARKWKHGLGGNLFGGTSQPTQKMQIGLDVQGWPDYSLEEIVAYGDENERRRKAIQDAYLNFVIESNDATAVANGRPQNQHLVDKTVRGAKANAAWEKEHPNLTAWSYLPSTAVIGTALAPLGAAGWSGLTALSDAAAATSTGQAITAGLAPLTTAASTSMAGAPLYTWADVGLSSLFGGHGVQTAIDEGGVSPTTALELAPLLQVAKPMFNETAMAVENYRYPIGRPQVPEGYSTIKPQVRTRVGDVEINNPQIAYRQGGNGIVEDFINSGKVRTKENIDIVDTGKGFTFDFGHTYSEPMFAQGQLNWGLPVGSNAQNTGLLTTSELLGIGNRQSRLVDNVVNGTTDIRMFPTRGRGVTGRVPLSEDQLNATNTTAYNWEPGYGYRRVFAEETPAAEWAMGRTAPQITAENAASITRYDLPSSDIIIESSTSANPNIPFDEAWLAASKGRHQMSNLVGSDDYASRVRQAYQDNGIPVNQADFEILQAKQGIEDSNLKVVPNLKSENGEVLNGQYDSNTRQVLVSQDRDNILDVVESSGHEHAHASEVDRLLELLKEKWKHIKPRKEAFTRSDGSVDTEWKDYISKIVEMRAPAMSVWSEMKDLGFSKVGDYLHHLKRFGLEDKQWEALVNRYGLTNAKFMVETVFGVSPFVISGVNNEEKDSTTM